MADQKNPDSKQLEESLGQLEKRLEKLRALYEKYFQGMERVEPVSERDAVVAQIREMHRVQTRNTAHRFRINQLVARINTFQTYWTRVCRQIEEGTYQRDLQIARYRQKAKKETLGQEAALEPQPAASHGSLQEALQSQTPGKPGPAIRKPPLPREVVPGMSSDYFDKLYDAYVSAKRQTKEKIDGLTKDVLASTLRKQVPVICKQYNCKSVEFKIVIKGGKAILKAVPKS